MSLFHFQLSPPLMCCAVAWFLILLSSDQQLFFAAVLCLFRLRRCSALAVSALIPFLLFLKNFCKSHHLIGVQQPKNILAFFFLALSAFHPLWWFFLDRTRLLVISHSLVSRCSTRRVLRGAVHKFRTLFKVLLARLFLSMPNRSYERINHLCFLSSASPSACSRSTDVTFLSRGRMAGPPRHWKASSGVSQ